MCRLNAYREVFYDLKVKNIQGKNVYLELILAIKAKHIWAKNMYHKFSML